LIVEGDFGSLWLRDALGTGELAALDRIADHSGRPGFRVNWTDPAIAPALAPVAQALRSQFPNAKLSRVVWFAKDAQTNWGVPWHQDRVIAVADRHEVPGFHNWSQKAGVWHCEPPLHIFSMMRFIRVHLDDCDETNGAMEIARGSEAEGMVPEMRAAEIAARYPAEICSARRGDIQILPMLVLHRSRPATSDAPRRALRLDYALTDLPAPLSWCAA
jgi:Phytanoyl-CoA dioxygenase (PhyH)